jgi:predicted transcriptional regulator
MYPELIKLMAYKHVNQTDLAKILGIAQQSVSCKMSGKTDFKRSEMIKLKEYFSDVCPSITMDKLFTNDIFLPE